MNGGIGIKKIYPFALFMILMAVDQLSKYIIRSKSGFYICNTNIAWNISVPAFIFWLIWVAAILGVLFLWIRRSKIFNSDWSEFFLVLILSGAVSNVIDRFRFGCVIDFIGSPFFPVFNLADSFITIGAILLLVKWIKL
jgi:signal peptidase II